MDIEEKAQNRERITKVTKVVILIFIDGIVTHSKCYLCFAECDSCSCCSDNNNHDKYIIFSLLMRSHFSLRHTMAIAIIIAFCTDTKMLFDSMCMRCCQSAVSVHPCTCARRNRCTIQLMFENFK